MWRRPPPPLFMAPPTLKQRARRAVVRSAWKVTRRTARGGWRHRRRLTPVYATALLFTLGAAIHLTGRAGALNNAVTLDALAVAVLCWWQQRAARRGRLAYRSGGWLRRYRRALWSWVLVAGAGGWLVATCYIPPWRPPLPGWLLFVWLPAAGIPWWWHHRIRPVKPEASRVLDWRHERWGEYVHANGGVAPGAVLGPAIALHEREPEDPKQPREIGWTADGDAAYGKTARGIIARTEEIAGVWDLSSADISIEPRAGASSRAFRVTVYEDNPLQRVRDWPGPHLFDPQTGIADVAYHGDGEHTRYRFYRRGSGPAHSLVSGSTDAGKSRFLDQLLGIERSQPFMASVILDPQYGQSLPEWQRQVALYAKGTDECLDGLFAVRQEMNRRNKDLSEVEWQDVVNGEVRTHYGIDSFDPFAEPIQRLGLPLLCLTVEEAHRLTRIDHGLAMLEEIGLMARKCGIKLRMVTQVPLLEQLGSTTLRDMVVSGNVFVFRTANRLSGDVAFNGQMPIDPCTLPKEWPDGSTTSGLCLPGGPQARSAPARTWFPRDVYAIAHAGETTRLPWVVATFEAARAYRAEGDKPAAVNAGLDALASEYLTEAGVATGSGGGVAARIIAHLSGSDTGIATTSAIALALGSPLSTISTTCRRMVGRGELQDLGHGMWGRPDARVAEQELAGAAA